MSTGYIPDGYTRKAFIRGVPRLYDDLHIEHRPARRVTRAEHFRNLDKLTADPIKSERAACDFVATRLIGWDLRSAAGEAVPLSADSLFNIEPALFERIYLIVLGSAAGDEDSEATKSEEAQEKN